MIFLRIKSQAAGAAANLSWLHLHVLELSDHYHEHVLNTQILHTSLNIPRSFSKKYSVIKPCLQLLQVLYVVESTA